MDRWYRVNKKRPCQICGRPDWCTYQENAACCMRVKSETPMRNGGYLHKTNSPLPFVAPVRKAIEEKPIDARAMWQRWFERTTFEQKDRLGIELGVDTDMLEAIGCAWAPQYNAYAFPMRNARSEIIGIRLRAQDGSKYAVKGSKSGLFLPTFYPFETE